jgi:hypothetical protein
MGAPSETRKQTLQQLRETFLRMSSPDWDLALLGKPEAVQTQAALEYARVQRARLRLGNAELADIRDKLIANEKDLEKGRQRLRKALNDLNKVKTVLGAVSSFLDVVGRVVALA